MCPFAVAMTWPKMTHQPSRVPSLTHGFQQEVAQGSPDVSEEFQNLGNMALPSACHLGTLITHKAALSITAQRALELHGMRFMLVQPPISTRT